MALMEVLAAKAVIGLSRLITGVQGNWQGCTPDPRPRVYFANHNSHGDFLLVWTVMSPFLRRIVRPVAGADYWNASAGRRFFADRVFRAVLIDRIAGKRRVDPVAMMADVLDQGSSLIFFPEGTRNTTDAPLLPFKTGLYHLANRRPDLELVPVWIDNLNRVMPKGEFIPIPLLCSVTFGVPLHVEDGEERDVFLTRARDALLALAPKREGNA